MDTINYYSVTMCIEACGNYAEHSEIVYFKSLTAAKRYAKKIFACVDVLSVDIIDETTGEVHYYHRKSPEDCYDAEE